MKVVIAKGPHNAIINVNGFVILTLLTPREAMIGVVFFDKPQIHFTCEKVIKIIRYHLIGTAVIHRQEYSRHCLFVLLVFLRRHNTIGRFSKLSATIDGTQHDNGMVSLFCICTSEKNSSNSHLCHGMTKSVKVHRKDQSVNKNAILASFVCFFNFPDRNLIILYKIT